MNPETPEAAPDFFADDSADVAIVDPADLSAIWKFMREQTQNMLAGDCTGIDFRVYQRLCSPGANVAAVWYRASMIGMLDTVLPGWMGQAPIEKVVALAATFPMKKMKVGVVHEGPPFDLQQFLKQLGS